MCFGGGKVWLKDQEKIYRHAKGLGIIDVPHPWGDDRKQGTEDDLTKSQWRNFTERLNTAKEGGDFSPNAGQSERSSDWYRTPEGAAYAASIGKPVGFGINAAFPVGGDGGGGGGSGGGGSGLLTNPGTGTGPYPEDNMYFPQLVPDYEAPQAQDWSQYMPAGSPFTGGMRMPRTPDVSGLPVPVGGEETGSWAAMPGSLPGVAMSADPTIPAGYGGSYGPKSANLGGLLYQPWSSDYQQQFVPENIWNYAPPEINRQPVQYTNPLFGPMNIIMPEEEGDDDDDDDDYDWVNDPEGLKGGKMPGDVGYETSSPFGGKSSGLEGGGQSSNNPADRGYTGGMGPVPR